MKSKQTWYEVWGLEPEDTEKVMLMKFAELEWAEDGKRQAEQSGCREVEIRIIEKQKPVANPVCPTCKGEGYLDLPFGGCQPCPDCQKQES